MALELSDKETLLYRKFSVGLCLDEDYKDLENFFVKNQRWLNSVYFSLPLGMRFYSRELLEKEYRHNEEKLLRVLKLLKELGIRREAAVNTWNLNDEELNLAVKYLKECKIQPEEIVCLRNYGKKFASAFPEAEIKYSVNNPESDGAAITSHFHTLVAGKGLLRDSLARYKVIKKGFHLTLLLNSGCIDFCNTDCESIRCHQYFDRAIQARGLDAVYAQCSFFPSELRVLLQNDRYGNEYKFKISNRPLGLYYTQDVLNSYLSLKDDWEALKADPRKLGCFCTARPLALHFREIDIDHVKLLKEKCNEENALW